jgi:hypothetical protein
MDIKARVPKSLHDTWKEMASYWSMSVNQYTKAVILEHCGMLPRGFWTSWTPIKRGRWLYGK